MDVKKREWAANPPKAPVDTLAGLVYDFKWRFPRERRDMVVEFCRTAPNIEDAIWRAVASRTDPMLGGKMHNHQSRVPEAVRQKFGVRIRDALLTGKKYAVLKQPVNKFDDLFDLLEAHTVPGIGPVTLYDVATRIGAFLEVEPTSLYLHAGVRLGVVSLDWALPHRVVPLWTAGRAERVRHWTRTERIHQENLDRWWPEFEGMTPDEVEDFLCTYRLVFADLAPEGDS